MSLTSPPELDEIEVSVFGPGRGECIVIHLGNDEWCVVDSCIPRGHSTPIALQYLTSLGETQLARVRLIVATHWHDDHIRGLEALLNACPTAKFSCSVALNNAQFRTFVAKEAIDPVGQTSGVLEFGKIFQLLLSRAKQGFPRDHVTPIMAGVNKRLLHLNSADRPFEASVMALSPSDGLLRQTFMDMNEWANPEMDDGTPRPQNDTSVVLWIEAGNRRMLLGADLEIKSHTGAGWLAVVEAFAVADKANFYKVAHHGSINGDCDEIWGHLLEEEPHAVVTPYNSSNLPGPQDVDRLKARTSNLYLTAKPTTKLPKRDALVEKELRRVKRRIVDLKPGHVRWRWKNGGPAPIVELFEGAEKLL